MKKILLVVMFTFLLSSPAFGTAVAQWKMNDNTADAVVVDSVGSYNGTYYDVNTPATRTSDGHVTGQLNGGLELNGTDEYIIVADDAAFSPINTPFSITAWINLTAVDSALDFEICNKSAANNEEWQFHVSGDKLYFNLHDVSANARIGRSDDANYSLYEGSGSYLFVVATYDGGVLAGGIKLYLDGVQCDDSDNNANTFAAVEDKTADLSIGKFGASMAEGEIDNLVIYNTELTQAQITNLYNNGTGTESVSVNVNTLRQRSRGRER